MGGVIRALFGILNWRYLVDISQGHAEGQRWELRRGGPSMLMFKVNKIYSVQGTGRHWFTSNWQNHDYQKYYIKECQILKFHPFLLPWNADFSHLYVPSVFLPTCIHNCIISFFPFGLPGSHSRFLHGSSRVSRGFWEADKILGMKYSRNKSWKFLHSLVSQQ